MLTTLNTAEQLDEFQQPTDASATASADGARALPREPVPFVEVKASPTQIVTDQVGSPSRLGVATQGKMESFTALQEWEGVVTSISAATFTAKLIDITAGDEIENEEATFSVDDLSNDDRALLREGAVFRWVIGRRTRSYGTKENASILSFRRLPVWTRRELADNQKEAQLLSNAIRWD